MTPYSIRLHRAVTLRQTPALVGLDPRWDDLPVEIRERAAARNVPRAETIAAAYEEFSRRIIDVVAGLVPAVKPQSAFFEQCGPAGVAALAEVMRHARQAGLIVICDAKRGDIGSTAEAYADAYLAGEDPSAAPFAADALTVNPFLGLDTLEPFRKVAERRGAGLYVLVRTSNPGSATIQEMAADGQTASQRIAAAVETWSAANADESGYGSVGAVVGATYPRELAHLRGQMLHVPLLVPGYGSQGGTAHDVAAAFDARGYGALINSSRGIIFAYGRAPYAEQFGPDRWEDAVAAATRDMIAELAAHAAVHP